MTRSFYKYFSSGYIFLSNKEKDYTELKKKYESLKLVKSLSSKGESVLAKKKIRKMIDDIDNCILNLMG